MAHYSNADDLTAPDDGITAFGGDAELQTGRSTDAPVALYISDNYPGGNADGLAQRSGTAFAAPITSADAARLWSAAPNATGPAVLESILKNPDGTERRAVPLGYA